MKNEKLAMLLVIIGNSIWGGSFMFSKIALEIIDPITLLGLRFLVAFATLNLVLLVGTLTGKLKMNIKGKNILPLLLLGLFQPVIYFVCEAYGIKLTTSTFSSVMIAMIPIVTLGFEALVMKMYPTVKQAAFAVLSVAGVVLIAVMNKSEGSLNPIGVIMLIFAILAAVGYSAVSRKTSDNFTVFERTYFMFLLGCIFYLPVAIIQNRGNLYATMLQPFANIDFLLTILYLGVLSSVVAFGCLNFAFGVIKMSQANIFSTLATAVAIFTGVVFLKEPFGIVKMVGSAMILIGLYGFNKFQIISN